MGLAVDRLARLDEILTGYVARDEIPGLAWLVARDGEVHVGAAGSREVGGPGHVGPDTIFRISSMTKPVTAVGALTLVEDCVLRLDEPIDEWLPELANDRVLRSPKGPLTETVAAHRPITLRDLLTFRVGLGMDFSSPGPQPVIAAMAELELGAGPPAPAGPPGPDEWMRRLGTLPLSYQPGERWLYHTSAEVLGVLVARASGQSFDAYLRERIFDPLDMKDTGFFVPPSQLDRFGACYTTDPDSGARRVYDETNGQWSRPPAFPSGGAGLVSTIVDYVAFAEMLRAGGTHHGTRICPRPTVEAMTTDQLTDAERAASGPDPSGAIGWGFGLSVRSRRSVLSHSVGTYGWDGGLGSTWANDPAEGLVGILMANQAWMSLTLRLSAWTSGPRPTRP